MKPQPVSAAELETLDAGLMVLGYRHGFKDFADFTQRDRAYWHGYLNGQVDGGFMQLSDEQRQLAREIVERWRAA
jgi:hypothetical protein